MKSLLPLSTPVVTQRSNKNHSFSPVVTLSHHLEKYWTVVVLMSISWGVERPASHASLLPRSSPLLLSFSSKMRTPACKIVSEKIFLTVRHFSSIITGCWGEEKKVARGRCYIGPRHRWRREDGRPGRRRLACLARPQRLTHRKWKQPIMALTAVYLRFAHTSQQHLILLYSCLGFW